MDAERIWILLARKLTDEITDAELEELEGYSSRNQFKAGKCE